jgi:tRNA G18 (ribose-2'-O)-methylase SpoU
MSQKVVILDAIRSAHNVGSIFRTADAAGVEKLYLCGPTPDPVDRFGRIQKEIAKTSLGASAQLAWEHVGTIDNRATEEMLLLIEQLKSDGYTIVAVEQAKRSVNLYDFTVPEKVVYIFGAEVEGVQSALLKVVDVVLELPMAGMKESLNVSVTAGIVLYQQ